MTALPLLQPPPARRGPRPLPLHLMLAASRGSLALANSPPSSPQSNLGSLPPGAPAAPSAWPNGWPNWNAAWPRSSFGRQEVARIGAALAAEAPAAWADTSAAPANHTVKPDRRVTVPMARHADRTPVQEIPQRRIAENQHIDSVVSAFVVQFRDGRRDDGNRRHQHAVEIPGTGVEARNDASAGRQQVQIIRRAHTLPAGDSNADARVVAGTFRRQFS